MRNLIAVAIVLPHLAACLSPSGPFTVSASPKPPMARVSAAHDIKLTFWNGDTLTDPGGLDEPCDRGCLAQAEDHLRSLGDAGTAKAVYEAQAAVGVCLWQKCGRR